MKAIFNRLRILMVHKRCPAKLVNAVSRIYTAL